MSQAYQDMMSWFNNGFGGNHFFSLYIICAIYLFIFDKDKRWKFVFPSLLFTVFILNPVCYKYLWSKTIGYSYWRLFWAIPVIPIVVMTAVSIVTMITDQKKRAGVAVLLAMLCLRSGAFIYSNGDTTFIKEESSYKLPGAAVGVADWLCAHDEHPRVVNDLSIAYFAIQIRPEIEQAFCRYGSESSTTMTGRMFFGAFGGGNINTSAEGFDWNLAYRTMKSEKFRFLVLPETPDVPASGDPVLLNTGFKFDASVDGYGIYETQ